MQTWLIHVHRLLNQTHGPIIHHLIVLIHALSLFQHFRAPLLADSLHFTLMNETLKCRHAFNKKKPYKVSGAAAGSLV